MINVTAPPYSAVGDGIADDTAAIQAAFSTGSNAFYFPTGLYKHGPLVTPASGVKIYGDGIGATQLLPQSGDGIHFLGQFITVCDLMIQPVIGAAAGHLLDFDLGNVWLSRVCTIGGDNIIRFKADTQTYVADCQFLAFGATGIEYGTDFVGMGFINNTRLAASDDHNNGFGILARAGDTFHWSNIDCGVLNCPIALIPLTNGILRNVFATNVTCDGVTRTNSLPAWFIDGSAIGAILERVTLTNCWAGAMKHFGFFIKDAKDVSLMNTRAIANALHGVFVTGKSDGFSAVGVNAMWNGNGTANQDGINIDNCVNGFRLIANRCGPEGMVANTQRYGACVDGMVHSDYIVTDNRLKGNLTGGLYDAGAGAKIVAQNLV